MKNLALKIAVTNKELNDSFRDYFKDNFDKMKMIQTPYGIIESVIYHMFLASNIWLGRIANEKFPIKKLADLTTNEMFFEEWSNIDVRFVEYCKKNDLDFEKVIDVKTLDGNEFKLTVEDILLHISHHSFLHRGHLGTIIRIHNLKPLPGLDWIDVNMLK